MSNSDVDPLEVPPGTIDHQFISIACEHCGKQIDVPVYCGNRFCPVCSLRRLNRIRKRLDWMVSKYVVPHKHRYKHLTLTIPSQSDCFEMVRYIVKSFRRLRQRAYWKNMVLAGAYVLEITGRPNNWHVHIHAIIVSRWIDWDKLLKLWLSCSKGRGVFLQDIPVTQVTRYLTKYLSKPSVPDLILNDVNHALAGRRLFSPFGDWHSLNLEYLIPNCVCSECGGSHWYPFSLIYGDHFKTFLKEIPVRSPPVPEPELSLLT